MSILKSFESTQRISSQQNWAHSDITAACIPSPHFQNQFNQISGLSNMLNSVTKSVFEQTQQLTRILNSPSIKTQLQQANQLTSAISQMTKMSNLQIRSAMDQLQSPVIKAQLVQMNRINSAFQQLNSPIFSQALEAYRSPSFQSQIRSLQLFQSSVLQEHLKDFQSISEITMSTINEMALSFDLNDIQFSDTGVLTYDGAEYSPKDIEEEFSMQMQEIKSDSSYVKLSIEKVKEKFWLIILLINLIMFIPQLTESLEFYQNFFTEIAQCTNAENPIGYTIKEKVYLREEANTKSNIIAILAYDTSLEILKSIPRWYQAKYIDENDFEQIGWISKISIEIE